MSLINCPECGNECSASATSCPNCGHPFVKPVVQPVVQPRVIIKEVQREDSFPKWIFIPLGILGVIVLFIVFVMFKKDDDTAQRNINVNLATARTPPTTTTTTIIQPTPPNQVIVPSTSQPTTVTTLPPATSTTTTTVVAPTPNDKGAVNVEAKILNQNGSAVPVSREKFYLLDKDLESILADAHIEDETGQGVVNAFGMSVVNPNKYRETNQKALAAIKPHIVYSTLTDSAGKADLKDVKPNSYYLFGIHKMSNGFAVWSSAINVNAGQNSLVIPPVSPTVIMDENE